MPTIIFDIYIDIYGESYQSVNFLVDLERTV